MVNYSFSVTTKEKSEKTLIKSWHRTLGYQSPLIHEALIGLPSKKAKGELKKREDGIIEQNG